MPDMKPLIDELARIKHELSAPKHTPGPWTIGLDHPLTLDEEVETIAVPIHSDNGIICWVDATPLDDPSLMLNSRLIAAAPAMFNALLACVEMWEENVAICADSNLVDDAKAAIDLALKGGPEEDR